MNSPRVLVANLDCELEMAARHGEAVHQKSLPAPVLRHISGAATLLRAFANSTDLLWTPSPVDPQRLAQNTHWPLPTLVHGPRPSSASAVLAWGETESIAALRQTHSKNEGPLSKCSGEDQDWVASLWSMPPPDPSIVRFLNHRRTSLELAHKIGTGLPQSGMVRSLSEIESRVVRLKDVAEEDATPRWVVKTPFSAAGRDRIIGAGAFRPHESKRIAKWLEMHGELSFEPWVDRRADFGMVALSAPAPNADRILGSHRLRVDGRGGFRGIHWIAGENRAPGIEDDEFDQLTQALASTLQLAKSGGYFGPIGIDAWRYASTNQDRTNFQALGEINARMTFGLVARALEQRLQIPRGTELMLDFSLEELPESAEWLLRPTLDEPGIALTRLPAST